MPRVLLLAALLAACRVDVAGSSSGELHTTGDTGSTDTSTGPSSTTGPHAPDTSTTTSETTTTSSTGAAAEAGMDATTDATTTDAGSSTTGPPAPSCGDGLIDPGESCDDMNDDPDDGCKLCTRDRLVFASSVEYLGWELDGLYGADQRCRMLAAIAMLPNFATYRAWLSDSNTAAADRILHSRGRYTLVNGLVVAADWDALISGALDNPINVTEYSEVSEGSRVWTGTLANGQPAFGSSFCGDWSEKDAFELGGSGIRNWTDANWSFFEHGGCPSASSIYCFEN